MRPSQLRVLCCSDNGFLDCRRNNCRISCLYFHQIDGEAEGDMGGKVYWLHLVIASLQLLLVLSFLKVW